jgi:hypothetical protein
VPHVVHIEWTYPKIWESVLDSIEASELGVYQIYRTFGSRDTLLYIGLVKSNRRDFYTRMNEHRKEWLFEKRGAIYLSFGHVRGFRGLPLTPELIEEVEGALIFAIQPPENTMKKSSYSRREDLIVKSFGYRGDAPQEIDTTEHG